MNREILLKKYLPTYIIFNVKLNHLLYLCYLKKKKIKIKFFFTGKIFNVPTYLVMRYYLNNSIWNNIKYIKILQTPMRLFNNS